SENQCTSSGTTCIRSLTGCTTNSNTHLWCSTTGIHSYIFTKINGEIEVLAGDISSVGRNGNRNNVRRRMVNGVSLPTGIAANNRITRGVRDTGTRVVQIQTHSAVACDVVDRNGIGAGVDRSDASNGAISGAGGCPGKVGGIDPGDVFVKGDRVI